MLTRLGGVPKRPLLVFGERVFGERVAGEREVLVFGERVAGDLGPVFGRLDEGELSLPE